MPGNACDDVPNGFISRGSSGNIFYQRSSAKKTFFAALKECQNHGATLALARDQEEYDSMIQELCKKI